MRHSVEITRDTEGKVSDVKVDGLPIMVDELIVRDAFDECGTVTIRIPNARITNIVKPA